MKVLYTHRTRAVGAEGAHIRGIYEAFSQLGHTTAMDCLSGCNPSERASQEKTKVKSNSSLTKKFLAFVADKLPQILFEVLELLYNVPLLLRLGWRIKKEQPDLIYERYSLNTFSPTLLSNWLGIKHILEVNDSVAIERSRPLVLRKVSSFIEGFCLRRTDLVITITEDFRQRLLTKFSIPESKVMVLTNAVSRSRFEKPFQREAIRTQYNFGDAIVLGGTGQFLDWHGLQELVSEIGPEAKRLNVHFFFIGDGPARDAVNIIAQNIGVFERVHFSGMLPMDTVPDMLSALDIAVIPRAAAHASPMKLLEYMAMGLPIVAPDMPSIRAALSHDSLGKIFPIGDMNIMGKVIRDLIRDPAEAKTIGIRARSHVFTELTWDRHVVKMLEALKR